MPTIAELRAKAQELQSQGVGGVHSQQSKRPALQRAVPESKDPTFTKLLRFFLYQANALDHVQAASVGVFVVNSDEIFKGLQAAVALWDQLPPQPHQGEGKWVPHPLGDRKAFLFASMIEQIVAHVPCFQEAAMKEVMTYLANLDVGTVLKLNVGSFGPRYPTPKAVGALYGFGVAVRVL
jgi:hypothetical protein